MRRITMVLLVVLLLVACDKLPTGPSSSSPFTSARRTITVETLPATHRLVDAAGNPTQYTVTVIQADVQGLQGNLGFSYWQDPMLGTGGAPIPNMVNTKFEAYLKGASGELKRINSLDRDGFQMLGDMVPVEIIVSHPEGGSTTFKLQL